MSGINPNSAHGRRFETSDLGPREDKVIHKAANYLNALSWRVLLICISRTLQTAQQRMTAPWTASSLCSGMFRGTLHRLYPSCLAHPVLGIRHSANVSALMNTSLRLPRFFNFARNTPDLALCSQIAQCNLCMGAQREDTDELSGEFPTDFGSEAWHSELSKEGTVGSESA